MISVDTVSAQKDIVTMQLVGLHFLLALLNFYFVFAKIPGMCVTTTMVTKRRFIMNRQNSTAWTMQEYQEPVEREECCVGYMPSALRDPSGRPKYCTPVCEPACEKGDCMGPNICACYPGHTLINNSTSKCYDVCDACINGACHGNDTECTCDPGYIRDENIKHVCDPICSPSCVNGFCSKPNKCECFDGFIKDADQVNVNVCVPHCSEPCVSGRCTGPNTCTCNSGYANDNFSSSVCLPKCNQTCTNGFCAEPDICRCDDGFVPHPRNPYQCIFEPPGNSYLNYCELKMYKAVKYDDDGECFVIKDRVKIIDDSHCQPLTLLSHPLCNLPHGCSINECIPDIQCYTVKFNGINEIHCNLGTEDFEEVAISSNFTGTEWSDMTVIVSLVQPFNFTADVTVKNETKEWCLHPLSTEPVCGTNIPFSVELCECTPTLPSHPLNSSFITFLNVFLMISFLLLVVAGASGFLWVRYRRMNNPLNYREDMLRGYYTNECYNHQTGELVSDDESDHDSSAVL